MLKKPWVWLVGGLAVVAAFIFFAAPLIGQYGANKTFNENLAVLTVKSKALVDKLNEPTGKTLIADAKTRLERFSTLQKEYFSAHPDAAKTGPKLDEIMVVLNDMRAASAGTSEDLKTAVQEFEVAMSVVVYRNPQLFAARQSEVKAVVKDAITLYTPVALSDDVVNQVDVVISFQLRKAGHGTGANMTPDELAAFKKEVVKTLLDRAATRLKSAPQP